MPVLTGNYVLDKKSMQQKGVRTSASNFRSLFIIMSWPEYKSTRKTT